jgi:hypothetical protein
MSIDTPPPPPPPPPPDHNEKTPMEEWEAAEDRLMAENIVANRQEAEILRQQGNFEGAQQIEDFIAELPVSDEIKADTQAYLDSLHQRSDQSPASPDAGTGTSSSGLDGDAPLTPMERWEAAEDRLMAENIVANRQEAEILRQQGNFEGAQQIEDSIAELPVSDDIKRDPEGYLHQVGSQVDRAGAPGDPTARWEMGGGGPGDTYGEKIDLSRISEIEPLHRTDEYADELLTEGGFSPPEITPNPIHEYGPMKDAGIAPEDRTEGNQLPSESLDALGFNPADGAYADNPQPEVRDLTLDEDLWLVQYYDGSKDLNDHDRTVKFWRPIDVSEIPDVAGPDEIARTMEGNAILEEWGPRTHVQVACIPADSTISYIESESAPQAAERLTEVLRSPSDPATGELRPELQPDHILENVGDVRLGGDDQVAFAGFDERWIRGQRALSR